MTDIQQYTAYIPVIKESETVAFALELEGESLLQRAAGTAKSASCVSRVVVRTKHKAAKKAASQLGIEVEDAMARDLRDPHFLVSLNYPFMNAAHFEQLIKAKAKTVRTLTPQRHHPVGAFIARDGRMDFSATLDSPTWRALDEKKFYQPIDALSLHYAPAETKRAYLVVDEVSSLKVTAPEELALASLVLSRGLSDQENGETLWQSP